MSAGVTKSERVNPPVELVRCAVALSLQEIYQTPRADEVKMTRRAGV